MAAEDPATVGELARSYQRIARSLRQTLALKARLTRERERESRANPPPWDPMRAARRQAELREAVRRLIWAERETEDEDYLFDLLEDRLAEHGRLAGFGLQALDDHIAALCVDFGLPLARAACWRDLPDPEDHPDFVDRRFEDQGEPPQFGVRRSSA
jgi:hypothetical protein